MFNSGFREVEGDIEMVSFVCQRCYNSADSQDSGDDGDNDFTLSDSDIEDEEAEPPNPNKSIPLAKVVSRSSTLAPRRRSTSRNHSPEQSEDEDGSVAGSNDEATSAPGELHAEGQIEDPEAEEAEANAATAAPAKKETPNTPGTSGRHFDFATGPKKIRVMVKDAAWSTWWAVLYWVSHIQWPISEYIWIRD
jgi:hypothetical protein